MPVGVRSAQNSRPDPHLTRPDPHLTVASLQLPGFELPPGTSTDVALTLRGRLSYGFLIGEDGYASFLRLEQAHLFEGTAS